MKHIKLLLLILLLSCSTTKESFKFAPTEECKICEELVKQPIESRNDSLFDKYKDLCSKYYEYLGDSIVFNISQYSGFRNPIMFLESKYFFDKSFIFDSTNNNINYKLAYLYNLINSTQRMKYHFQKVNDSNLKVRNIFSGKLNNYFPFYKQKQYFELGDSLTYIFKKFKNECSITFKTYCFEDCKFPSSYIKIFENSSFTIYGNGYFKGEIEYEKVKGYLTDDLLEQFLSEINNIRIFSLNNHFFYFGNKYNRINLRSQYYITDICDLYYEIIVKTPVMSFSLPILGLLLPEITLYESLNYNCPFSKNICNLEKFWLKYYNYDFLKQYEIKK